MRGRQLHQYTETELYTKMSSQCAMAEYCISDVRQKMRKLGADEGCIDRVTKRLVKEGFIDEARYAIAFVRDKFRYNRWGRVRIAQELRLKGIMQTLIDEALNEISDEDYETALVSLIRKKQPSVKGQNDYEVKVKLMRFAISRGFEMDIVRKVVDVELSVSDGIDDQ